MKTKPKSPKQIAAEADRLMAMKPNIPRYTAFGDNNHAAIDAQVDVLTHDWDEDEINLRTQFEDEEEDDSKWKLHQQEAALQARWWADGQESVSPSKSWECLVKNNK
jgi:hypothetical protein